MSVISLRQRSNLFLRRKSALLFFLEISLIVDRAKIPPAVNQIEAHAYLQQPKLLEWSKKQVGFSISPSFQILDSDRLQNIVVAAYSPLGNNIYNLPRTVDDPIVVNLAKDMSKQPAQLLISWAVQRGTVVLPKSVTASRIADNFQGKYPILRNNCPPSDNF